MGENTRTRSDVLKFKGNDIKRKGYGVIPKLVMQDKNLTIEAKAIYSYMASYAGAGDVSFPGVDRMISDLGVSRSRFYKHRSILERCGYITIETTRKEGKRDNNIYFLNQTIETSGGQSLQSQNLTVENLTQENLQSQNLTVENVTANNNSINNNSINNNSIKNNNNREKKEELVVVDEKDKSTQVEENKKCSSKTFGLGEIDEAISILDGKVNASSASTILRAAKGNMALIKEKYEIAKATGYKNLGGYMVKAIKEDWDMPKSDKGKLKEDKPAKQTAFHNFEQRSSKYDKEEIDKLIARKQNRM